MKNLIIKIFSFLLLIFTFTGCTLIGDIFEAGIWVGIIVVVLVIALIFWIVKKML